MAKRNEGEIVPTYLLWTHNTNKAGLHPVKLRLIHQRNPKYYAVMRPDKQKLFLSQKDYDRIVLASPQSLRGENRAIREILEDAKQRAKDAIREATGGGKTPFSFGAFERKYLGAEAGKRFLAFFKNYMDRLQRKGQAGTVRTYSSAYRALTQFLNGRDIDPADVNVKFLNDFDDWLRTKHVIQVEGKKRKITAKNDTSVSIYMRCIRSVYNELAASDEHLRSIYPFSQSEKDKGKYKIPASTGGQKGQTLTIDDLKLFLAGEVEGDKEPENPMYRAKQLFLFSFFAQGINFKDMALLTYANVTKDIIEFSRRKTIRTRKEPMSIRIPLTPELKTILIEQGNVKKDPADYVFNVFNKDIKYSEKEIDDKVRQWIKTTNKWLGRYCERNKFQKVSTYAARHTFASFAKLHLQESQIMRMLGHSRLSTTQVYLGRFEDAENKAGLDKVFRVIRN